MVHALGTSTVVAGQIVSVPTPCVCVSLLSERHPRCDGLPCKRALSVLPSQRRQGCRLARPRNRVRFGGGESAWRAVGGTPPTNGSRKFRFSSVSGRCDRTVRRQEAAGGDRALGVRSSRRRRGRPAGRRVEEELRTMGGEVPSDRVGMAVLERLGPSTTSRTCGSRRSTRASRTSPTSSVRSASSKRPPTPNPADPRLHGAKCEPAAQVSEGSRKLLTRVKLQ